YPLKPLICSADLAGLKAASEQYDRAENSTQP
ncbi:antibiotic acetyltransferase, partial [Morganella morganii]